MYMVTIGGGDASISAALRARQVAMTIDGVSDLDLSCTPPLGSPWHAIQTGARAWARHHTRETR